MLSFNLMGLLSISLKMIVDVHIENTANGSRLAGKDGSTP